MKRQIAVIFFLLLAIVPLAAGLCYALLYSFGMVGVLGHGFTLTYWEKTLTDSHLWMSIGISLSIAFGVTAAAAATAMFVLVYLYPWLCRRPVRLLLHLPLALPPIIAAFVAFQWLGSSGMLARVAVGAGWIADMAGFPAIINDPYYSGVMITLFLGTFPFLLLLFLSHYESANAAHYSELAATLGASVRQINRRVVMPVILRRSVPTLMLYVVFLFGAYEVPLLLGQQSETMISVYISQKFKNFSLDELPVAYCATVIYAVVVLSISHKLAA